ncbi:hypothetical protein RND71_012334 [Anisodus tanguticus]|uniref:Cell wall protein n=1 Tax=Anisodus tanguticus TaxID=243964 RepID=A0AAE1VGV4_9SOLA|nr:hypothetical protein RND71_012334 [Anisodus tanguticus]
MSNIVSFLFILGIFLSFSCCALAGRDMPNTNPKISDKKLQPDSFIPYDGTVLIPGFGRVVVPPKGSYVNPFTYNPITGTNTGSGLIIPNPGSGSGPGNIPGGDDTLVPNPGVEVPTGGTITAPPSRH